MKRCFFTLFLTIALTAAAVTAELETRDGTIYRNVTVEQVDPAGLTIGFINENGTSVLKRIPFEELDAAVQQQYRYDPERARRYEERREQLSRDSIEEMKASSEQAGRTETIRAKLRERFNGKNVEVNRDDLLFLIRSNRRALRVNGVEAAESGTLVRVLQDDSGLDALPMMILADGLKLKTDESWTGFLYPTGLKARIQGNANLPVFCSSAEMAADLVSGYLDIYYQFVASGGNDAAGKQASAPATTTAGTTTSGVAGIDTKDKSSSEPIEFGNIRNYSGYYFGNSYYPVWWYYGTWWNRYPARPLPPPIRPGRPFPPFQPGWPCPPERPECPERPERPGEHGGVSRPGRPTEGGAAAAPQRPVGIQSPSQEPASRPNTQSRVGIQTVRPAGNSTSRPASRGGNIIPAAPVNSGRRAMGRF